MSFYHGLGMFIFGMSAFIIGAIIAYFIINKVMERKDKPKRFDDLEWKFLWEESRLILDTCTHT